MTKRKDGRYEQKVTVGRNPETGKLIRIPVYGKTKAELTAKVAELTVEKERGSKFDKRNITVAAYRSKWYETKLLSIKTVNTKKMYDSILNNYFEVIDDIKVRDIQADDLQLIINANKDKKRTCQKIKLVFNQIFKAAVRERIIYYNPAEYLVIPPYKAPEKRNLTDDEDILSEVSDFTDREKAFVLLIKYFGLRKEEALAVKKSRFNFEKMQLEIKDAIIFDNNQPVLKATKNEETRFLPIMSNIASFLQYYLSNLEAEYLFVNLQNKSYMTEQGYRCMWESIRVKMIAKGKELGKIIKDDLTAHIFRHNYAYMLMYAGVDMKERQYLLGHKSIKVTMDIYTHIEVMKMRAPQRLEEFALNNLLEVSI